MKNEIKTTAITRLGMSALEARGGYSKLTLLKHQDAYRRLQKYCTTIGTNKYSETIGQQFLEFVQSHNPSLSSSMLTHYKNGINKFRLLIVERRMETAKTKNTRLQEIRL